MITKIKNLLNTKKRRWLALALLCGVIVAIAGGFWAAHLIRQGRAGNQAVVGGKTVNQGMQIGVLSGETPGYRQGGGSQAIPIRLSAGQAQPQEAQPITLASGEPLSEDVIQSILVRLPPLVEQAQDQTAFQLPDSPIPPPRPGATIPQSFPPAASPPPPAAVETGPLQVLRYSPEGELFIAPFLSVTFNQAMVPLATLQDLSAEQVPVKIDPALPGVWRWVGTRTLTFQYAGETIDRLPKATIYQVTVPAGTKSASGNPLRQSVQWTFSTPPPQVAWHYPDNEPQPLEPLFFIHFDQNINPEAVLPTIKVMAGSKPVAIQLASEADIKTNTFAAPARLLERARAGYWLAFKASQPLPPDSQVDVTVGPGTPSAEGPRLTESAQSFSFRTYARLRVDEYYCNQSSTNQCLPLTPFYIRFNNPLDVKAFSEAWIKVTPELPGASIDVQYTTLTIHGAPKGQTRYTVTLDKAILDQFGQTFGQDTQITFNVGSAEATLFGPEQSLVTIDPAAKKPAFSFYTMNHARLSSKIYAVQPADWPAFREALNQYRYSEQNLALPGKLVQDKTLNIEAATDSLAQVDVDLSQFTKNGFGHFIVYIEPPAQARQRPYYRNQPIIVWVQITQLGLDAFTDPTQMVAWTTRLKDGAPLKGVTLTSDMPNFKAITGADGLVRFAIPDGAGYLVATLGDDQALLPNSLYAWGSSNWRLNQQNDELRWYMIDDRQMYRPGEEAHFKGWIRKIGAGPLGDVSLVGSALVSVSYEVYESQGNLLTSGQVEVNALGGFDFTLTLPQNVNLGNAWIQLNAQGGLSGLNNLQYSHSFQIQEFRRPEFEVTARNETSGPYFAGEQATLAVAAKYYAGDALPNAEVTWQVSSTPGSYSPPNWPDFTFGSWTPWWKSAYRSYEYDYQPKVETVETFTGLTDASGTHYLQLNFGPAAEPRPVSIQAQATVMDVNRQAWSSATTLLVHPANLYVGLRSPTYYVPAGQPLKIDLIVTDLDGNPVVDQLIDVRAARLEWKYKEGFWQEVEVDVQTCQVGSQTEPITCTFQTPVGGSYQITATVTDDRGRQNQSQFTRWVSGGQQPPARKVEQEQVTLIPDKESYQPGETANILVQAPFTTAEGLLTVTRSGILYTERFQVKDGTASLEIPIKDEYIPNLNIQVDLAGSAPRTDDQGNLLKDVEPRPAYATGTLNLRIPPLTRTLSVQATPEQKELEPGGKTNINVTVKDARGNPVPGAELTVIVVDEAVLALSNYQLSDPLSIFYTERSPFLESQYGRASIILIDPRNLSAREETAQIVETQVVEVAKEAAPMATRSAAAPEAMMMTADSAAAGGAATPTPIYVRTDFNPLATFAPAVHTDANGAAQVPVKLPDNLTRYRILVVAVDENRQFGSAEANLTARLPLMVRPSAPRFLNFGDQFELPVVLQNQTDQPLVVDVVVRASNLAFTASTGIRVSVPAHDRLEVRFPATTQMAGTTRLQVAAVSGTYADSASIELPVYTPATTEAFATYGVIDTGAVAQPILAPTEVFPQFGGLDIQTSSTALHTLTDAMLYLVSYPFECSEQLASRVLGVAALRDVLTAFKAEGLPSAEAMQSAVLRDLVRLQSLQNDDGGFPYWQRGKESIPFNTIHVGLAVQMAREKGFAVPEAIQPRLLEYLRQVESHYPDWYGKETRQTLSAYALYVRNRMNDRDPQKALKLLGEAGLENLSLEAIGWLWPVLQGSEQATSQLAAIRQLVANRVVETAGAANFTTSYNEQTYLLLSSDRRTDAILLDALMGDDPQSDLIPKVVNGLLAHRTKGRWGNTQENVFVLLALDRYFNLYEAETPDFVARLWLGEAYAGEYTFQGRTTDRLQTTIPMDYLMNQNPGSGKTQNLILSKDGAGRLYYRLGLSYAPTDLKLPALDMGFVVQRIYEAVDDPADVRRDETGIWQIKAGARVRVRLTMVADSRRYHVALVDHLPAGLEILNPTLAVSEQLPREPILPTNRFMWWWWTWYNHQNLRDERAEAFTPLLWEGTYEYTYLARATTPGTFVVPPAKAEEMYSPEVFGRSSGDIVIIK